MTILVTGATGNVGSAVANELQKMGAPVRAFVRDAAKAGQKLDDRVEIAVGDFSDAGSIRRALDGVDRVFLSSADSPAKVDHEVAVIDGAAAAGVNLIVKASTVMADADSSLPPIAWNGSSEDHLRESGVPAVILQSMFYMTNLFAYAEPIKAMGKLFAPAGDGKIAMIDPRDVGMVGANVLNGDGHNGKTYTLTGPEPITFGAVAEELSRATGRSIDFVDVPDEAARQGMIEAGLPEWLVDHLTQLFQVIRQGALADVTGTVEELTGRRPRSFAEFATDHAHFFGS